MKILLSGALARRPGRAGHTWVFLNYVLGLRRLGHDIRFVDSLAGAHLLPNDEVASWRYASSVMEEMGVGDIYALRLGDGRWLGIGFDELHDWAINSDLLLNFNGYLRDPELSRLSRCRVYIDIDPGFAQAWQRQGLHESFIGHDVFVTVALRMGNGSSIPNCGRRWITTLPPVVLDEWKAGQGSGNDFTTVASWRGTFGVTNLNGYRLGHRVHEFRRVLSLPFLSDASFELALDIDASDHADREALERAGWRLVDPSLVASDPRSYRTYIHRSRAEFSVAKQAYVVTNSGWFSDRSACYLASGRPVVAQDTGWSEFLPSTCGLVRWATLDDAVAAVRSVREDRERHDAAAKSIARAYFDSERVLERLIREIQAV